MIEEIEEIEVPQPPITKYRVGDKTFDTLASAEYYTATKGLTKVYVVLRRRNIGRLEVFSTRELAENSLSHTKSHDYFILEAFIDEFLR